MRAAGAPESAVTRVRGEWFVREARHFAEAQVQLGLARAHAEQLAAEILETQDFPPFEVFAGNVDAFRVFTALDPYWEYPGDMGGGRLVVPLPDVEAAVRMHARRPKDCMRRVMRMLRVARVIRMRELQKARASRK